MEVVQIQLNYADWENPVVQSGKLYEVLRRHGLPILVMEPVKGGTLATPIPKIEAKMQAVTPGASAASWALRFVASLPGVVTTLSGMSSSEQMRDNLETFRDFHPLSEAEQAVIKQAQQALMESDTVPCTACRYCTDGCPKKIKIPDIFKALNTLRIYGEDARPHFYYSTLIKTSGRASDCIGCGQCERVCPQHLPIISLLKNAAERLDTD